jgi:hypothetical protein
VNGAGAGDGGVAHGARLVAFTEAVMAEDDAALKREREALLDAVGPAAFVDACALVGAFNIVDRIADATGIPLDGPLQGMSVDLRGELDLARFAAAANTPGAREGR